MDARELEGLSREELVVHAESIGVLRPSVLTRAELIDEILRCQVADPAEQRQLRGLLGVARDLLASVVERGLHLPDAAAVIRGPKEDSPPPPKAPLATITLAEIYAKQGHKRRALAVLDQILAHDPDQAGARGLRDALTAAPEPPPSIPHEPEPPVEETTEAPPLPEPAEEDRVPSPASSSMPVIAKPPAPPPPEEPVPMLDDEPLPPRYEVDEIVALPVDPRTLYVYWEALAETLDEARSEVEEGRLVIRIVAVTASWDGPIVETRDIEVQARVGDWFVRDLPPGAILRAALGWRSPAGFQPFAIALEIGAPQASPSPIASTQLARFTKDEGALPIAEPSGALDSAYARAVESYRRKLARSLSAAHRAAGPSAIVAGAELDLPQAAATGEDLRLTPISSPSSGAWSERQG